MIVFDIETNGLLNKLDTIHVMVLRYPAGSYEVFRGTDIEMGVRELMRLGQTEVIAGHNVIGFDIPAIQKLYPWFDVPRANVFDSLVASRLIWSNMTDIDLARVKKNPAFPKNLIGRHSLESWGHRLGNHKGDYKGGWEAWSREMEDYCIQDTNVTRALLDKIVACNYAKTALDLEHDAAWLCAKMERNGFPFDEQAAAALYARLCQRRVELEEQLRATFSDWTVRLPDFIPARDNKTKGYKKGVPVPREKLVMFNPQSRDHIADRLITLYGWEPKEFTDNGKPKVDENTIKDLTYPPIPLLVEYLTVAKRIGQVGEGSEAWLKQSRNGRIHGAYNPNGAVTGRATHSRPNIAQVPANRAPYGKECRSLFGAPKGWHLVGADASGLELRCLAHFMARWDAGRYGEIVVNGDVHTENQKAAGLPTRDNAKTFIYAFLYGAGDEKIGSIVGKGKHDGTKLRLKFLRGLPALRHLKDAVQGRVKERGFLSGLDGRQLHVRSQHSALNTLLQSAGALVCKKWITLLDSTLAKMGLSHGWDGDYAFVAWVHDEVQIACRTEEVAKVVSEVAVAMTAEAGSFFNFRCPITGEAKTGTTWATTH
jgi:DNA polymerase I